MRPCVAVGGLFLDAPAVGPAEQGIDAICETYGFPTGDEFKWSPGSELWMKTELVGERRQAFYLEVLELLANADTEVVVVIVDEEATSATGADTPEEDATRMFLERASGQFTGKAEHGVVIVDRPPGDRKAENQFTDNCVDIIQGREGYARAENFALAVMAAQSRFVRLLQAADVITACTLAHVAGETRFAPPIFEAIRPMLARQSGRVGGFGVKIHPDFRYGNLYHWLLGDTHFWKSNAGHPMPFAALSLYASDPGLPQASV